jgi:hypothetical protein
VNILPLLNNPYLVKRLIEQRNPEFLAALRNPVQLADALRAAKRHLPPDQYNNVSLMLMSARTGGPLPAAVPPTLLPLRPVAGGRPEDFRQQLINEVLGRRVYRGVSKRPMLQGYIGRCFSSHQTFLV